MSLRVNTNIPALSSHSELLGISTRLEKSVERLSSGLRINRAADDAAGLTISEKLRRQVRGLARATMNAQDGISMIQSAEGALNETHSILHRMRELAIQSSNDTLTSNDRLEIQKEIVQLRDDINRIAYNTEFNTKRLLDGSQSAKISTSSAYARGLVTGAAIEGGDYQISLALLKSGVAQLQTTQIFSLRGTNELAKGETTLQSIAQLYDANGVFLLEEPQALTLHGNSRSAEIVIDAYTSLDNLAGLIQSAMVDSESGLAIDNSVVKVIVTAQTQTSGLGGYVEIVSGAIGEKGNVSFAGEQNLISALGIATSRQAVNNFIEVSLKDRENNIRTTQIDGDRASGLLHGIDIQFDSQTAQVAGTRGLEQGLYFSATESFTVEAGGQSLLLIVASGYSTMEGLARSFNMQTTTASSPIAMPGLSASVVDGEIRLSYQRPASVSSSVAGFIKISFASADSVLGFQDGIYGGFADGRKNQDKLTWGFTKYRPDVASGEISAIEVSDGQGAVILDIATALSSAPGLATVADMVSFEEFKARVNNDLKNATVAVRLDQIDGAMAFTSTRVGKDNVSDTVSYSSIVAIKAVTATGAVVSATRSFLRYFGIDEGTKAGKGDTNFRFHVQQNDNQYHIGANQAEVMKVSFSDMSASALGVDNLDLTTIDGAQMAIGRLNKAIDKVSAERSKLGAFQNRLEFAITNLRNMNVNATAAESRIRDTDMAQEMIEFTRNQVMKESATAMLAQANSGAAGILSLLR